MADKITEPVTPTDLNPAPLGPLSGNWNDDDREAYEGDFEQADHGPEKVTGVPHPVAELPVATRLITRSVTVGTIGGALADPILILPRDDNRISLSVTCIGSALGTFRLGTTKSDCYNGETFSAPANTPMVLSLDGHTGGLWAYSVDAANAITLSVVAVTK
jgi:hypothetical protein